MKTTKLLIKSFVWMIILLLFTSCESDPAYDSTIWIDHAGQITVLDAATLNQNVMSDCTEAGSITFITDNAWTSSISYTSTTDHTTWLRLSPDYGDAAGEHTVRLLLDRNNTVKERSAMIEFRCGSSISRGTISQFSLHKEHLYRLTKLIRMEGSKHIVFDDGEDERLTSVAIYNSFDSTPTKLSHSTITASTT